MNMKLLGEDLERDVNCSNHWRMRWFGFWGERKEIWNREENQDSGPGRVMTGPILPLEFQYSINFLCFPPCILVKSTYSQQQ